MTESSEDRDEFLQIYLEECNEGIEQLVKLLLRLEQDPEDMQILREAFRMLHTFKGSAGMMGYQRINALAHELEARFDACRSGRERMSSELVSVALRCVDFFGDFLTRLETGDKDQGDPGALILELARLVTEPVEGTHGERSAELGDVPQNGSAKAAKTTGESTRKIADLQPIRTGAIG